jgi:hypothetical protein
LNQALADVDGIVAQFLRVKNEGASVQEALAAYEAEVFVRGKRAALESLDDASAVMTTQNLSDSRLATQGLAK